MINTEAAIAHCDLCGVPCAVYAYGAPGWTALDWCLDCAPDVALITAAWAGIGAEILQVITAPLIAAAAREWPDHADLERAARRTAEEIYETVTGRGAEPDAGLAAALDSLEACSIVRLAEAMALITQMSPSGRQHMTGLIQGVAGAAEAGDLPRASRIYNTTAQDLAVRIGYVASAATMARQSMAAGDDELARGLGVRPATWAAIEQELRDANGRPLAGV